MNSSGWGSPSTKIDDFLFGADALHPRDLPAAINVVMLDRLHPYSFSHVCVLFFMANGGRRCSQKTIARQSEGKTAPFGELFHELGKRAVTSSVVITAYH